MRTSNNFQAVLQTAEGIISSPIDVYSFEQRKHALQLLEFLSSALKVECANRINNLLGWVYSEGHGVNRNLKKAEHYRSLVEDQPHEREGGLATQQVLGARDTAVPVLSFIVNTLNSLFPAGFDPFLSFMFSPFLLLSDLGLVSYEVLSRGKDKDFMTALTHSLSENKTAHRIITNAFSTIAGALFLVLYLTIFSELLVVLYALFSCYRLYENYKSVEEIDAYIEYVQNTCKSIGIVSNDTAYSAEESEVIERLEQELAALRERDRPLEMQKALINSILVCCLLAGVILLVIPPTAPIGFIIVSVCVALQGVVAVVMWLRKRETEQKIGEYAKQCSQKCSQFFSSVKAAFAEIPKVPDASSATQLLASSSI